MQIRQMRSDDLSQVNSIFARAFSEARVEEGLKHNRVSPCRPEFMKMYLDRSGEGAFVAEDRQRVAGFSFSHLYGLTGWMGPIAVLPRYQGAGVGKTLVTRSVDYLRARGAKIMGLETMPRNFRNIGFYMRLGFEAGPLCLDVVARAYSGAPPDGEWPGEIRYFNERTDPEREEILDGIARISEALAPGLDYRGEVLLNTRHKYGDTVVLVDRDDAGSDATGPAGVAGFAVCHVEPYGQFEEKRELKVNVLAISPVDEDGSTGGGVVPTERSLARLAAVLSGVRSLAAREGLSFVRVHPRADKWHAMRKLLSLGFTVAYSDLRMWVTGYREDEPASYVHFCRWQ
jgi:ribosomal protein S18 acetylase RimI-like enzyme